MQHPTPHPKKNTCARTHTHRQRLDLNTQAGRDHTRLRSHIATYVSTGERNEAASVGISAGTCGY